MHTAEFHCLRKCGYCCLSLVVLLVITLVISSSGQRIDQFEVRLSDGILGPHEGRLEVYYALGDSWGVVTSTGWGLAEANVVCRQLGFLASFPAAVGHTFSTALRTSVVDRIKCSGSETRLDQCVNRGWLCSGDCSSDNHVGVRCLTKALPQQLYQVRLTGSTSQFEGLVEVRYNDYWGPVCGTGSAFDFLCAVTVCRQLGYGPPKHYRILSETDPESRPKLIHSASCHMWHRSLLDCEVNGADGTVCSPSHPAAYVACNRPADLYPLYLDSLSNRYEGAVRIYSDGQFGTVCNTNWTLTEAEVVCRQLGYGLPVGPNVPSENLAGPSYEPILLDAVQCDSGESFLAECSHKPFRDTTCQKQDEASVQCQRPELEDFSLRIADGNAYQGRLEVAFRGQWMAICNDTWDLATANVSCRQIGLGPARSVSAEFDFQPQFVVWNEVACQGTEERLDLCKTSQTGQYSCSSGKLAGVTCSPYRVPNPNADKIRLIAGILPHDGAVQLYKNSIWQAVCPSGWDNRDAVVACRHLGYHGAVHNNAFNTEGPFYMDNVACQGSELNLTSCSHSVLTPGARCEGDIQAGVTCNPFTGIKSLTATTLRLVGGDTLQEGQLQVYFAGVWGTVCSDKAWDMNASHVACRQLGYERAEKTGTGNKEKGMEFLLGRVECLGTELMLSACAHAPWGQVSCPPNQAATVVCKDRPGQKMDSGVSEWLYIGIVIAVIVIVLISVLATCVTWSMKKKKAERRIREGPDHHNVRHEHLEQRSAEPEARRQETAETKML